MQFMSSFKITFTSSRFSPIPLCLPTLKVPQASSLRKRIASRDACGTLVDNRVPQASRLRRRIVPASQKVVPRLRECLRYYGVGNRPGHPMSGPATAGMLFSSLNIIQDIAHDLKILQKCDALIYPAQIKV